MNPLRARESDVLDGKAVENVFNFAPEDQQPKLGPGQTQAQHAVIDTPMSMKLGGPRGTSPYKVRKSENSNT